MLDDSLVLLAIVFVLVALDVAALRWGVDSRIPSVLREPFRRDL